MKNVRSEGIVNRLRSRSMPNDPLVLRFSKVFRFPVEVEVKRDLKLKVCR